MTDNSYLTGGNRPFYLHFTFEHEGLACAIHDLQRSLQDTSKSITTTELSRRLSQLRQLMTKHFQEEEGGCFDEICAQHPHMCSATRQMETAHRMLLAYIDRLTRELDGSGVTAQWKVHFHDFAAEMKKHEQEELAFVRRGLHLMDEDE
ncbi:hemerythrin domain-containing protein [Bremerella sp. T1]|uniref:hemerythrin domain-containing protein n=1 Tax=Bremerella sp. TYQ1 TaxID=3119568 RepID=UPI001CC9BD29|nr:hemerythrin domain-containing protein [Bremerella volcania]UBM34711.1 hemerythrin domain-containing protein [Bremerella volcania]